MTIQKLMLKYIKTKVYSGRKMLKELLGKITNMSINITEMNIKCLGKKRQIFGVSIFLLVQ